MLQLMVMKNCFSVNLTMHNVIYAVLGMTLAVALTLCHGRNNGSSRG